MCSAIRPGKSPRYGPHWLTDGRLYICAANSGLPECAGSHSAVPGPVFFKSDLPLSDNQSGTGRPGLMSFNVVSMPPPSHGAAETRQSDMARLVESLNVELASEKIDLPSFPD